MKNQSAKSSCIKDQARCRHRTLTGRRCRLGVSDAFSGLCCKHLLARDRHIEAADLLVALTGELAQFKSAYQINDFLSRLLLLLAQERISPRHAGVMAYISSLHLRTLREIDRENNAGEDAPAKIILDVPRPDRSQDN